MTLFPLYYISITFISTIVWGVRMAGGRHGQYIEPASHWSGELPGLLMFFFVNLGLTQITLLWVKYSTEKPSLHKKMYSLCVVGGCSAATWIMEHMNHSPHHASYTLPCYIKPYNKTQPFLGCKKRCNFMFIIWPPFCSRFCMAFCQRWSLSL